MIETVEGIGAYFKFYNEERFHQSLGYRIPGEVYNEELGAYDLLGANILVGVAGWRRYLEKQKPKMWGGV